MSNGIHLCFLLSQRKNKSRNTEEQETYLEAGTAYSAADQSAFSKEELTLHWTTEVNF